MIHHHRDHKERGRKLAVAASVAASIVYSLGTVLVLFLPDFALKLAAAVHHLSNLDQLKGSVQITLTGYVIGLVTVFVFTYIFVALTTCLYHTFLHAREGTPHH